MLRMLLAITLSAVIGIAGPAAATMAQQRITAASLEELRNKLEYHRNAYHRLDMAEQEALAEGAQDRAAVFASAKAKAHEQYVLLNAELRKAQKEKQQQDKRNAQSAPDYR